MPLADWLPGGPVVWPPKPLEVYPNENTPSVARNSTPQTSVVTGCAMTTSASRAYRPSRLAGRTGRGQNVARPNTASSAGSRVSAASSMRNTPRASAGPSPEYSPNVASSRVSRATMTVPAENVIDSPTWRPASSIARCGVDPSAISSRTRMMKNSP